MNILKLECISIVLDCTIDNLKSMLNTLSSSLISTYKLELEAIQTQAKTTQSPSDISNEEFKKLTLKLVGILKECIEILTGNKIIIPNITAVKHIEVCDKKKYELKIQFSDIDVNYFMSPELSCFYKYFIIIKQQCPQKQILNPLLCLYLNELIHRFTYLNNQIKLNIK